MTNSSLELSPEEMRAVGYRVIDMLVEHFATLPEKPVTRKASRPEMEARLREALPARGMGPHAALDQVENDVFANIMHLDHPRFFAFVPSPSNFMGAMADALTAGFNPFAGTWLESSGPTMVELTLSDWLRRVCGLPDSAGGIFVSGGSMANLTALALARHARLGGPDEQAVIYCSDQTHSSINRGLAVLGFRPEQVRLLPSDDGFRLDLAALREAVAADKAAGRRPFCVAANAGTTNTGAVDPLPELGSFCRCEDLWLHVDGAYGAAAALTPRGKAVLAGLGEADSITLDPHKWLFQPYECGCLLVRDEPLLAEAFRVLPEYLADIEGKTGEINYCDRGIQLTRGFRALKLWLSLKAFGADAFAAAIEHGFTMAEVAERTVRALPGWEVVTPAQMGIVTFRCRPAGLDAAAADRLQRALVAALQADGSAFISSTVLRGRTVLRMCVINPRTTEADVEATIRRLDSLAQQIL